MRRERVWIAIRGAALPALWVTFAAWIVQDWIADPYDGGRLGTRAYFHNQRGALAQGLTLSAVELVVILAIVRPWSYRRSWGRSAGALAALLPWAALCAVPLLHAGGVAVIHFLWVASLVAAFTACCAWSGRAAWRAGRGEPAPSRGR